MAADKTNVMPLSDLLGLNLSQQYTYRRAAAIVAILVTAVVVALCVIGLVNRGVDSFSSFVYSRGLSGFPPLLGLAAFVVWVGRYSIPACRIIMKQGSAIESDGRELSFFGMNYPLIHIDGYAIKNTLFGKDIILISNGQRIGSGSMIFVEPCT